MKKYLSCLGASLVAIAALSSCNKELTDPNEGIKGGIPFEITAASVDTKTSIDGFTTSWVANDAINLFHAVAGSTTYTSDGEFTIAAEDLEAKKFKGTLASALTAGNYDWYAIYPYKEQISSPADQTNGYVYIGHSVAIYQNGNDSKAHLCGSPCPLYGVSKSIDASSPVSLEMKHLTSVVEINVTNSNDEPLTVSNISISTDEDIVGSYYINFAGKNVVYNPSANYVKTVANLIVQNGTALAKNETASFYIPIKPHVAENGSSINISVNGYKKSINLTKDVTFTAGKIKKISFDYDYVPTLDTFTAINDISKLSDGASLLIVGKSGEKYYQLPVNPTVSSGKVAGVEVTVTDNVIHADATSAWTATKSGDYWQLSSGGSNIYHSTGGNSGTNLAYGTSTAYPWSITNYDSTNRTFKLAGVVYTNGVPAVKTRGMLMSGTTFGGYALSNIDATGYSAIMLFVKAEDLPNDPAIIANDITEISARGVSDGESSYTIENPVDATTISATCDGTVVTAVDAEDGLLVYAVSANKTTASREGSITLTYGAVTKVIKVSQLAPVFTVSRTVVELEAAANSSSTITVTSDFDWMSEASTNAGFTSTPTACEWNAENPFTDGKTTVTIKATAENASEEGTKTIGTLTFTNVDTEQVLEVTVTQKTSYVAPVTGKTVTFTFDQGQGNSNESLTWTDNTITLTVSKGTGSSNPNEHAKDKQLRFYANNTLTVSGATITKITFNVGTWQDLTMTAGSISNKVWTPKDNETVNTVTFTNSQSSQAKYNSITIEYK